VPTSKFCSKISGATAENWRQINATGDRKPGATATLRRGDAQFLARLDLADMTRRDRFSANFELELATAPGDNPIVVETETGAAETDFENGGGFIVADKKIRNPGSMAVKSPA
jgi:hypothetical protein